MRIKNVRETAAYMEKSVRRLSVIADRPLKTKDDIFAALLEYQHTLLPEQTAALMKYVKE